MPKPPPYNPMQTAITKWIDQTQFKENGNDEKVELLATAPKRFTIYEPMTIFPSGSFTSPIWKSTISQCAENDLVLLWTIIAHELSNVAKSPVTHLSINEGIPLLKKGETVENILRSPTGLQMIHGDFGPSEAISNEQPTDAEFDAAFWVTTKQNGIHQTWAPRWTMFSRGNVKEKARLLTFPPSATETLTPWAVDLYAGIGYFVFSYASMGARVVGWELNPWSVEGLRRGALMNKWKVKVIRGQDLELPMSKIMASGEQIVIFQDTNENALAKMAELQELGAAANIRHLNAGFLPTSEPTWRDAAAITAKSRETWLHLHENVATDDIERRAEEIEARYKDWTGGNVAECRVSHVEKVKTFAPGVWHCVFDVYIRRT